MPVLVLLTPVGLDGSCWQWINLPEAEVLAYEFPGHGSRPWSPELLSLTALAEDVLSAAPPGEPLHLVGVSFGGMLAQHVAMARPDRIASLFLACTPARTSRETLLARATQAEQGEDVEVTMRRWFSADALARDPQPPGLSYARERLRDISSEVMADSWRSMAEHDGRAGSPKFSGPVTCVAGDHDVSTPPDVVEQLAAAWPGSRLLVLAGPHMLLLERPDEFSSALLGHLHTAGL